MRARRLPWRRTPGGSHGRDCRSGSRYRVGRCGLVSEILSRSTVSLAAAGGKKKLMERGPTSPGLMLVRVVAWLAARISLWRLSSASLAFFARISSRRCCILPDSQAHPRGSLAVAVEGERGCGEAMVRLCKLQRFGWFEVQIVKMSSILNTQDTGIASLVDCLFLVT